MQKNSERHIPVKEAGLLKTFTVINIFVRDKDVSSTQLLLRLLRLWLSSLKTAQELKPLGSLTPCSYGFPDTPGVRRTGYLWSAL